jgi:nucleoside-diphosphate-sugar epimerase
MAQGRVLVTGRHGFTGQYVARALELAGWKVWGGCSHPTEKMDPFDRVADLTDAKSVEQLVDDVRPDAVVHLAGIAFVAHRRVEDFYRVNLLGTRNLLEALSIGGYGQRGVVVASTANVYGNARVSPISESTPTAPANDYAVSKLAMEYVAMLFNAQLPITIARPFNYTGVGQNVNFLVPKIVSHFRSRAPKIELGNLDVERDFSDVRDVAAVYAGLLGALQVAGETVNICSGRAIALGEIIDICQFLTGHTIEVAVNPAFVRTDEIKTLHGDPTHVEAVLGGVERHRFEDTLAWMLASP